MKAYSVVMPVIVPVVAYVQAADEDDAWEKAQDVGFRIEVVSESPAVKLADWHEVEVVRTLMQGNMVHVHLCEAEIECMDTDESEEEG